jgi:hypothetical protein
VSLTAANKAALREAYDAYRDAGLGDLNRTADELRRLCVALGYTTAGESLMRPADRGFAAWARRNAE